MAAPFQIFQPAYHFVDEKLGVFLNERADTVMSEVAGPLRAALVLYVILYGFAILRGSISEPIMDFAVRSLKLAFVYLLATTVAYSNFVTEPLFYVLPDTLARAISGSGVPDIGAAFDQFFARAAYLAEKISKDASPIDFGPWILSALVYLIGALAAALGFGVVLIAKVALALLVALGPIFIACALFDATRRFFFGWLSQAVNYLVLFALIITIFQLVLSLVAQHGARSTATTRSPAACCSSLFAFWARFLSADPRHRRRDRGRRQRRPGRFRQRRVAKRRAPSRRAARSAGGQPQRAKGRRQYSSRRRPLMRIPILILCADIALGGCSTFASPEAPVCDGRHRRPANLYGSVLVPARPAVAPEEATTLPNADAPVDVQAPVMPARAPAPPQGGCA